MLTTDALIIGGGPAGLAAAIALRRKGLSALVVDHAHPPIDKTCGEGLMPDGIEHLRALGIELDLGRGRAFSGIRFINGEHTTGGRFPAGPGIGMRRTTLHEQLVTHAQNSGVILQWGVKDRGSNRAAYIIGADGQNSVVRREAGLDSSRYDSFRYGFRQHFQIQPWSEFVEVYWDTGKQIYIAPVGQCEVGVAVLTSNPAMRVREALACFPALARRFSGRPTLSRESGALTRNRRLQRVTAERVALLGDASGSVDAVTGEGLALAFAQARDLAEALARDDLSLYEKRHVQIFRRPRAMARLLMALSNNDSLRRRALHSSVARPEIFDTLLGFHVQSKQC
jgi:flavin-dependent dehydrogenase